MRFTALFGVLLTVPGLDAQSFEVASVKAAARNAEPPAFSEDGAQLSYSKVTLITLLMRAYGLKYRQIVGPEWLSAERYDVMAKLPESATKDQIPRMLQSLLEDRFSLAVHRESRLENGYALTVAKSGPKMKPAPASEGARRMKGPKGLEIKGNATMPALAGALADALDCPVVDGTALSGAYQVDLNWTPGENPAVSEPALASALQAELGLKLETRKYPVEYLIVDHAEKVPLRN